MDVYKIARVVYEATRAYDNFSQPSWKEVSDYQKEDIIKGVIFFLENPVHSPEDVHRDWMKKKKDEGWIYGNEKNTKNKTHPCIIEYNKLSENQRFKNMLFKSIVEIFRTWRKND